MCPTVRLIRAACSGVRAAEVNNDRSGHFGRGPTADARDHGRFMRMLRRLLTVSILILAALPLSAMTAGAADAPSAVTGLFLTTRYPALTVRAGETTTIDLSVRNFKLPPQVLTLSVPQIASGWKATILGGGQPVGAIEVAPDSEERLQLRLEPPSGAGHADYDFTVEAKKAQHGEKLPIKIKVGE